MDLEAYLSRDFSDDLDSNAGRVSHAFGGVGSVSEGKFYEGKAAARGLEQGHGAIAILHGCRMDLQRQCPAIRIDHRVPLAAFDLLARIVAAGATSFGRFHGLAVNDGGTGACFTPDTLAVEDHQVMVMSQAVV